MYRYIRRMNYRSIDYLMSVNDGINPYGFVHHYNRNYRMNGGTIENFETRIKRIKNTENENKLTKYYNEMTDLKNEIEEGKNYNDDKEKSQDLIQVDWALILIKSKLDIINYTQQKFNPDEDFEQVKKKLDDERNQMYEDFIKQNNMKSIFSSKLGSKYTERLNFKFNKDDIKMIEGSNQPFVNDLMFYFYKETTPWGTRFEDCYIKTLKDYGIEAVNNNTHGFYSNFKNKEGRRESEFLPYDINVQQSNHNPKSIDELKCYITLDTIEFLESKKEEFGFDGVFVQLSKLETRQFTPYFKLINDELKLFNILDKYYNDVNKKTQNVKTNKYSRIWINDSDFQNVELNMLYLLKDGMYELKLNNGTLFDFKLQNATVVEKKWDYNKRGYVEANTRDITNDTFVFNYEDILEKANTINQDYRYTTDGHGKKALWINKKFLFKKNFIKQL